jgi:4-hydroxy-tetrahydrodipicolinate synthase
MAEDGFHGVFPYLVSPIGEDGKVKDAVLSRLVEHVITAGVHGLAPLGSTGEFAYLSWHQKKRVVDVVLEAAAGRVPVIAGVAATTTDSARSQAAAFEKMGVAGIIAVLEAYFPVLADVPNIRYIKDASTNTGRLLSIMAAVGDRIQVFAASSHIPAAVMLIGGKGWMAGPACLIPAQSVELYDLCRAGRWQDAMALQNRLWRVNQVFAKYSLAACVKGGLELMGFEVGAPLAPQPPLDEAGQAEVRRILESIGVACPAS